MTTSQIDGSWELAITVTDLLVQSPDPIEKKLRVLGDTHLGAVILQITECFEGADQIDWSNFALWWPEKKRWLLKSRATLDQMGIQSDSHLMFTPTHKNIDLQLPDLQKVTLNVDFSLSLFRVVKQLCKEIGIRHPEELSLTRRLTAAELKKNFVPTQLNQRRKLYEQSRRHHHQQQNGSSTGFNGSQSPRRTPSVPGTPQGTLMRTPASPYTTLSHNGTLSPGSTHSLSFADPTSFDSSFIHSPQFELCELLGGLYKVKGFAEKARVNYGWMDSSLSLYEQDVNEGDLVILKYKYSSFYDLNPKYDSVRINQLYEQLKNGLIIEDYECTNEEMIMFAAFQLQIQKNVGQDGVDNLSAVGGEDEVDAALNDLQMSLDVGNLNAINSQDITQIPELSENLKFYKPKKFQLKSYKKHFFVFKDTTITMYRNKKQESVLLTHNLKGCEVIPDLNIAAQKFVIKLYVPACDGLQEFWIRCEHEDQYTKWLAACRCASKGKSMADNSFIAESKSIASFIKLQRPSALSNDQVDAADENLKLENYVPAKHLKKLQTKQITRRIIDSKNKISTMPCIEAKLNYIKAIQSLPDFGISYFIVKMKDSKKEELLGVASNRCILMDLNNGTVLKTWHFKSMQSWNVNWELRQVEIVVEGNKVCFRPMSTDCKVVHEFIGAYIFLAMRSAERSQTLDEPLFQKLTGGWQ